MKFTICSIFAEMGYHFDVTYLIRKMVVKEINEIVIPQFNLKSDFPAEYTLGIVITTKKNEPNLKLEKGRKSKKYKTIDHFLWIPYEQVVESPDYLIAYLDFLFEGINLLLQFYGFDDKPIIMKCKENVFKEIDQNPELRINSDESLVQPHKKMI